MAHIPLVTLELQAIEDLALSGAYSGLVNLSNTSAALILSAALWFQKPEVWKQPFEELTPVELDRIDAITSLAIDEVMASMVGTIVPSATAVAPQNTLLCDGQLILEADFPELYAVLDPVFIVDALSANVPDLRDRFVAGEMTPPIGATGGQQNVTLTEAQIPSHNHSYNRPLAGVAIEGLGVPLPVALPVPVPATTGDAGGGASHPNLPPFIILRWYIISGRP